ncbi:MAG: hypothetical protein H6Q43_3843 [Deltaproteobacteria bacterium]|jgi:hypothetical protein|nr:hypothetical protein [Deltaproteobacteria bacterium]
MMVSQTGVAPVETGAQIIYISLNPDLEGSDSGFRQNEGEANFWTFGKVIKNRDPLLVSDIQSPLCSLGPLW